MWQHSQQQLLQYNLRHVCDDDENDDNVIMSSEDNNEVKLRDVTLLVNRASDVCIYVTKCS